MNRTPPLPQVLVLGHHSPGGAYILRIKVRAPLQIAFGQFKRGKLLTVPAGECLYVGSALGRTGAMSLGRRLVRHATRSPGQAPHEIRSTLLETCRRLNLGQGDLLPKAGKRLFWNVDHLLDHACVDLSNVIAIRSAARLEATLGRLVERDPRTFILARGLGANDLPGHTHLLGVAGEGPVPIEAWWCALVRKLRRLPER